MSEQSNVKIMDRMGVDSYIRPFIWGILVHGTNRTNKGICVVDLVRILNYPRVIYEWLIYLFTEDD